jgi:Na+-translocating ferredoxin:NAD+ oxidoreductase subunit B
MSVAAILLACLAGAAFAAATGALLGWAAARWPGRPGRLVDRLDALLPQTQCRRCLYAGCRPYATAIARGEADIDRCPPGGDVTARALAQLLEREPRPVDPRYGTIREPVIAWIDEDRCIGCARCLPACPVDAIVGASRFMHTVIREQCTGCELCVPACPVDCIEIRPLAGSASLLGRVA